MNTAAQTGARYQNSLRQQARRKVKSWRAIQRLALAGSFAAALSVPALVAANDTTWNIPTSGNWNTASNWTAGVPADVNTTIVRFGGGTSYTATQNIVNNLLVNEIHFTNTGVGETVTIAGSAANRGVQLAGTTPVFNYSAVSNVTFEANANVRFNVDASMTGNGSGVLTIANLGASGAGDRTFTVNLSNPAASINVTTLNISNNASVRTLTLATTSNATVGSIANGSATTGSFIKSNGGILTILGAGTYTGSTTLNNGTVTISGFDAFGTATTPILFGNQTATNVATISYTGATASYTRGFNLGLGGGRLDVTNVATTLSIDTGIITAAGPNSALTKLGAGTLALNTANSYGGATTILAGTLIQGDAAAFGTSKVFSVSDGALLNVTNSGLTVASGGSLTAGRASAFATDIQGNTSLTSSALNVAGSAVYGTLTQAGNLSLNGGTLQMNLNNVTTPGVGVNDLIEITGDLTLGGTIAVNITPLNGTLTSGTYRLFNYTGALTGSAANFATPSVAAPGRNAYTYDTSIAGQINLNVAASAPGNLTWVGGTNANAWDLQTTVNWTGETNNTFFNGDTVNFTDAGLANATVDLIGVLEPFAINVSNTTGNYVLGTTTTGSIGGAAAINKSGDGTLTLQTANSFNGAITITGGTVIATHPTALGTATGATTVAAGAQLQLTGGGTFAEPLTLNGTGISNAGALQNTSGATTIAGTVTLASAASIINNDAVNTLTFDVVTGTAFEGTFPLTVNGAGNIDINDPISNGATGGVIKNGTGTLTLSGTTANGATGGYTVNGGILQLNKTAAIDAVRGSVTIGNGTDPATVKLLASNQVRDDDPFTINANATFDLNGFSETIGVLTGTGTITNTAGNITVDSGNFGGLITGAFSLTKADPGILILSGMANTFTGTVRVNNGTLEVFSLADSGPGSNGTGTIQLVNANNAAATLKYSGSGTTLTRPISVTANGGGVGNAILESSGSGPLIINAGVSRLNTGAGLKTFVLSGTNTDLNTISGVIENGAATLNLAKDGPGTWRLTGDNTYTGTTTITAGTLQVGTGGTVSTGPLTNNATFDVARAGLTTAAISGTGTTTVNTTGASLTASSIRQTGLTIGAGNKVFVPADGTDTGVSRVTALSINATGQLDLNNNDLIVDNGNLAAVTLLLKTGLDITGAYGGGPGITSTTFATNPLSNTVLGVATNAELGYATFSGQAVDANDILVKYTYFGDADLNGVVDTATDFDLYITGLTSGGSLGGWLYGDFDYNGTVDSATDFDLYVTGLSSQSGALLTAGSAPIQAVPEPGTWVLGGLSLLGLLGCQLRPRRKSVS